MKSIKKLWFTYIIITSVILSGCINDDVSGGSGAAENTLRFTFTMPESLVNTRSVAAEEGENTVNDLLLLFFEPTTNGTGTFVGHYQVPEDQLPKGNEMEFSLNVAFENGLSKSNAYSILAMANMAGNFMDGSELSIDGFIYGIQGMTQDEVIQTTKMYIHGVGTDEDNDSEAIKQSNLPMSAEANKAENEANVSMKLIRAVARFDIINGTTDYIIESVSIWNAYTSGSVWTGSGTNAGAPHTKRYYGVKSESGGFNKILGGLYAFENVSVSPEQNDEITTCLILGVRFRGTTQVTYYRLNVNAKERGQYLKRNNVYQITISGVNGGGEMTEQDAYTNGKFLLDASINAWDRDEDGLIIRNGDNLLALPTRKAVFKPEAEERQYYVYTMGKGTLEMSYLDMPIGMNAWLDGNNLYISVTEYSFEQRKGSIELRFAGMSGIIEILQSGKTEKFLTLSHTTVPNYPAGWINADLVVVDPIRVASSGSWTAQIYSPEEHFSFQTNSFVSTLTGENGDYIQNVYNLAVNGEKKSRTSFILVSLNDDPDNYRNVIVLTQNGSGDFTINPSNTSVNFEPDRTVSAGSNNEFTVTPTSEGDNWTVQFELGLNADKFTIEIEGGLNAGSPISGTRKFKIVPNAVNDTEEVLKASVVISLNEDAKKQRIAVSQSKYDFTVSPKSATVPATGGSANINIASTSTNLRWSAKIVGSSEALAAGLIPYLKLDGSTELVTEVSGQPFNTNLKVVMPGIDRHLTSQPQATVTITLDGTNVTKTVTVTQDAVTYVDLYAQSVHNSYGSWNSNQNYFQAWIDEMRSAENFGPGGSLYAKSAIRLTSTSNQQVLNNARIFNVCYGATKGNLDWEALKNNQYVTFVLSEHDGLQTVFNVTGFTGYTVVNQDVALSTKRTVTTDAQIKETEIYKYLVTNNPQGGGAPWTPINPTGVDLRTMDANNASLSAWPDTFIPLIFVPGNSNRAIVGVDPTNRLVFIGDTELFSQTIFNNNYARGKPNNVGFMDNLISYLVNVANYGDAFNNRFINDRSK